MLRYRWFATCFVTAGLILSFVPALAHAEESTQPVQPYTFESMTAEDVLAGADENPQASETHLTDDVPAQEGPMGEEQSLLAQSTEDVGWDETTAAPTPVVVPQSDVTSPTLIAKAHVQNIGWQQSQTANNGRIVVGTTGQSLRIEALELTVANENGDPFGTIFGKAHVQNLGWAAWREGSKVIGTTGSSLRMEALRLKLDDTMAVSYDLWYHVHVQDRGWMGWTSNGQLAGTAGFGLRLEAVEIALLPKGSASPDGTGTAFADSGISANAHVQNVGWQGARNGYNVTIGTTGQGLRMEALSINRPGTDATGDITYEAHVQNVGWQSMRKNGQVAGSTGRSQRIEALKVSLTDELADAYDVWYRLHVQDGGWMAWASNGQKAGTEGLSMRVEAIQIALMPKGSTPKADGQTLGAPFVRSEHVSYRVAMDGGSWRSRVQDGASAGSGSAIKALDATVFGDVDGSISYSAHVSNIGWMTSAANGEQVGNGSSNMEAFTVSLGGDAAKIFNVWYRGYVHDKGWMGWACNGAQAGSVGCSLPLDNLQICLVPKSLPALGSTVRALYTKPTINIVQMIYPQLSHGSKPASCQKYIVMHDTEGIAPAENAVYGWVASGNYVAAHFVIGLDGKVVQCVPMDNIAHHAGWGGFNFNARYAVTDESRDDRRGTAGNRYSNSYGMNSYSIGIELVHVSASHTAYPEAQLNALDELVRYIDIYYGFESQIIQHKDWRPGNSDCSDEFQPILANLQRTRSHN